MKKRDQNSFVKMVKRFCKCADGLAATEFAILLPFVMIPLFFGLIEASNAMLVNRKTAISANMLADLTAQSEQIQEDEIDDLFQGVLGLIEVKELTNIQMRLISIVRDDDDDAIVHWSRQYMPPNPENPNTPVAATEAYAEGSLYTNLDDDAILTDSGSLIVVEMVYTYLPSITRPFKPMLDTPIVFDRKSVRWPRLTSRVQLCDAQDNCTS